MHLANAVADRQCGSLAMHLSRPRRQPFSGAARPAVRPMCACRATVDVAKPVSPLRQAALAAGSMLSAIAMSTALLTGVAHARMEGVNKPELLPKGQFTTVIDVAGFLTDGEEQRIKKEIAGIEADTGYKLRVLCQNYPNTPGLAIKDYWGVDDSTIVFVADPNTGNIINFNVGANLDLEVPQRFWTSLAGKYGNKFYWQDNGEGNSVLNAVSAIDSCLREPQGRLKCAKVQEPLEDVKF